MQLLYVIGQTGVIEWAELPEEFVVQSIVFLHSFLYFKQSEASTNQQVWDMPIIGFRCLKQQFLSFVSHMCVVIFRKWRSKN